MHPNKAKLIQMMTTPLDGITHPPGYEDYVRRVADRMEADDPNYWDTVTFDEKQEETK